MPHRVNTQFSGAFSRNPRNLSNYFQTPIIRFRSPSPIAVYLYCPSRTDKRQACRTVEYQLDHLETLVAAAADARAGYSGGLTPEQSAGLLQEALEEAGRLQSYLVQQVFRFSRKKEIELFIQNYQSAITGLLDRLHTLESGDTTPAFVTALNPALYQLLSFIEDRFSAYFDLTARVPAVYWELVRQELRIQRERLKAPVAVNAPEELYSQVLSDIDRFLSSTPDEGITYKDILFYRDLLSELLDLDSWSNEGDELSGIERLLLYLNFNDKNIVNAMVNRFGQLISDQEDADSKIDVVLRYSKAIQQLQFKPDSALHVKHPSLKGQLLQWLSEELYYQERKINQWTASTPPVASQKVPTPIKVLCNATVDQLGIFFRAAADIQLLNAPSQRQLFNQISPYLATPHKKELSGDSMRSKSYNPEKKDLDIVKDLLMQLYKQVMRY